MLHYNTLYAYTYACVYCNDINGAIGFQTFPMKRVSSNAEKNAKIPAW